MKGEIRLVISGTYSTGKTTTATALSLATGIPLVNALSAREILTDLYPGRRFQDMDSTELIALGLKRLEERIREEGILYTENKSFITDGSVLNEWIYAVVRMMIGINPGANLLQRVSKNILGLPLKRFFKKYIDAYGQVVSLHAKQWYTDVVHLPVEFEMKADGHRPVSEKYRMISDRELRTLFDNMGFTQYVVKGDQRKRLEQIIQIYELPIVLPIDIALARAEEQIIKSREYVAMKIIEQYKKPSVKEQIRIITKY